MKVLAFMAAAVIIVCVGVLSFVVIRYVDLGKEVPDHDSLQAYQPPVTTRVHAGDGSLIIEFARERRLFVPYETIPEMVVNAFVSGFL